MEFMNLDFCAFIMQFTQLFQMMLQRLCGLESFEEKHKDLGSLGKVRQHFLRSSKVRDRQGKFWKNSCVEVHILYFSSVLTCATKIDNLRPKTKSILGHSGMFLRR